MAEILVNEGAGRRILLLTRNALGRLEAVADETGAAIDLHPEMVDAGSARAAAALARRYLAAAAVLEFPTFPIREE